MGIEEYNNAKDELENIINKIDKAIMIHKRGNVDGYTISKTDVMNNAKTLKIQLLTAWDNYKSELQGLVN